MMRFRFIKKILCVLMLFGIFYLLSSSNKQPYSTLSFSPTKNLTSTTKHAVKLFRKIENKTKLRDSKVLWENHTQIELDLVRRGNGERGKSASLKHTNITKMEIKNLYDQNGFNAAVSDIISVHRSVRDMRYPQCKRILYENILPSVSIIIPVYQEHWTTMLRTVHSLIDRAPRELVKELILVDDFSSKKFLGKQLDDYMSKHYPNIVKIIRNKKREGLIRSRIIGAHAAQGEVLVYIDSHCECQYNWLPPLLEPIKLNHRIVTCPFIDVINEDTFKMVPQDEGARGSFDWNMDYKRLARLPESENQPEKPFDSPIMAGGLFAIHRDWFWELGGYDEGLDVWGGEQYELSFKVWMCGGKIIDIPCSRIGHIYRKFSPVTTSFSLAKNIKRVAEVWMDEWKQYVYKHNKELYRKLDAGNLDKQKAIRERLQCKSFTWFLKHVAFDLRKHYPEIDHDNIGQGQIYVLNNAHLCLDVANGEINEPIKLSNCSIDDENHEQQLIYTWRFELQIANRPSICLDYNNNNQRLISTFECHKEGSNQKWIYNLETKQIFHPIYQKCIKYSPLNLKVSMTKCNTKSPTQKWKFSNINIDLLKTYLKEDTRESSQDE